LSRLLQEAVGEVAPELELPWYVRFVPASADTETTEDDEAIEVDESEA
jgi:hypothetical protein